MNLKNKLYTSIIHEFLEFCYKNAEVDLYPDYFYGNEVKIINDFLKERNCRALENEIGEDN